MFAVDLHTHSRPFHPWPGEPTPVDPVWLRLNALAGRLRGIDGFALTNHDYTYSAETTLPTLPGVEVSTTLGHVLLVGPDPPSRTEPGMLTPAEAVDLGHERGCAAILAHPFRNSAARDSGADFDAVEINGKNLEQARATRQLARRLDLPLVGGSDAHYPVEVGRTYTLVDTNEFTAESIAEAIRDGRVEPRARVGRALQVVDRLYTQIHDRKGWIDLDPDLNVDPDLSVDPTTARNVDRQSDREDNVQPDSDGGPDRSQDRAS